jgi:hypothetical protein
MVIVMNRGMAPLPPAVVSARPPKIGAQQSGQLLTKNTQQIVTMQQTFDVPGVYTVQVGAIIPLPGFGSYDAVADVSWRVEGGEILRSMSVGHGASISGTGQGVRVTVYDRTVNLGVGPNHPYTVNIQAVPGSRPSNGQPVVLTGLPTPVTIPANGTYTIFIPTNAGVISFMNHIFSAVTPEVATNVDVFVSGPGGTVVDKFNAANYPGWVPLVAGSTTISFANNDAVNDVLLQLNWGVDG